jgi:hypothetical protein
MRFVPGAKPKVIGDVQMQLEREKMVVIIQMIRLHFKKVAKPM